MMSESSVESESNPTPMPKVSLNNYRSSASLPIVLGAQSWPGLQSISYVSPCSLPSPLSSPLPSLRKLMY